jgi:hypothetical protein
MDVEDFDGWLALDESRFVGHIYDLAMPVHLGEHDYDDLLKLAPDRAYVVDVHYRLYTLVSRFDSLNVIYKMLTVQNLPLQSQKGAISRATWVRIILDVLLARITSVRDCTYLLIAEVFEIRMNPRNITLRTLRDNDAISDDSIFGLIDDIANIGKSLRDERDLHLHRGEERPLGDDPITYRTASTFEAWGLGLTGTDRFGNPINLEDTHKKIIEQIEKEFISTSQELESKLYELFDALYPIFLQKFRTKRQLSQLD